jgi:hypothetical protein
MIDDTIATIEARVRAADALPGDKRQELEKLLAQLRTEVRSLPREIRRAEIPDSEDAQGALQRLEESLTGFETTHPQVVGMVNRISTILANMGI